MIATDSRGHLLRHRAESWMARNPLTMALMEKYALEMAARGRAFGIKMVAERARWAARLENDRREKYKINSSYVAYIAREMVRRHPHIAPLICMRLVRG